MTGKNKQPEVEKKFDPKYLEGEVAYRFAQDQNFGKGGSPSTGLTKIALDTLLPKLTNEGKEIIKKLQEVSEYYQSPQGMKDAATVFHQMSEEQFNSQKVGDLYKFYEKGIGYLSKENQEKVKYVYNNFKDQTLGSIKEKIGKANSILEYSQDENLKGRFKKEEIEEAEKTLKKYETFISAYQIMYQQKLREAEDSVWKNYNKLSLEAIVKDVKLPAPNPKKK